MSFLRGEGCWDIKMNNFCTFFDRRYLVKGLALYRSMTLHCNPFHLWVLCMDEETRDVLAGLNLDAVTLISLADIEKWDGDIVTARNNRSLVEFYFTCKPFLCLYIMQNYLSVDLLTYLDADILFFDNPAAITDEMHGFSIGLSPHRFPPHLQKLVINGIYNAGWLSFRRDNDGLAALEWWRERCLEWCCDRVENGRYADQGYLNQIPHLFRNVVIIQNKGANLAPWNVANYHIDWDGERLLVDGEPLLFFHFHGLKPVVGPLFDTGFANHNTVLPAAVRNHVYVRYLDILGNESAAVPASLQENVHHGVRVYKELLDHLAVVSPALMKLSKMFIIILMGLRTRSIILYRWRGKRR